MTDAQQLADDLAARGVAGVTIHWADNNGIPRSRTVPVAALPRVAEIGVGITTLFAVFDSHDAITFAHEPLSTPSGDVRLVPVLEALTPLAGQPALAWVPGRQVAADGSPWPYDQRGVLERQVAALAEQGLTALVGYEMEFTVTDRGLRARAPRPRLQPARARAARRVRRRRPARLRRQRPPARPAARRVRPGPDGAVDRGGRPGHRGRPPAARPPDPARRRRPPRPAAVVRAAARAHHGGQRLAHPLVRLARRGQPAAPTGPGPYVAGILRDLPAVAAVTAPSLGSLARLRPGYFAGAFAFWGVENREAPLRYIPGSPLLGAEHANVELKTSDASANPYLALAAVLAAGAAGIADGLELPAAGAGRPRHVVRRRARRARHRRPARPRRPSRRRRCATRASPTRSAPRCSARSSRCGARTPPAATGMEIDDVLAGPALPVLNTTAVVDVPVHHRRQGSPPRGTPNQNRPVAESGHPHPCASAVVP